MKQESQNRSAYV